MIDAENGPIATHLLQSNLAAMIRTLAKQSKIKCVVKGNCNHLILTKLSVDILLDEIVVNKAIFYDPALSARPGGRQSSSLRKSKTGKTSASSKSCDFRCCLNH